MTEMKGPQNGGFPDYGHFGRFISMIKQVEAEVGIRHLLPKPTDKKDTQEIITKNQKAQKHESYRQEEQFLTRIFSILKEKIKENTATYYEQMDEVIRRGNRLPGETEWSDDPVMKAKITARFATQNLNQYRRAESSPYFGKVVFLKYGSIEPMELYFGKAAIDIEEEKERVIDWRAPVADLYYKYTGSVKNAFFKVEDKQMDGDLKLKRQISIEDGLITMISDGNLNEVIKELEEAVIQEDSSDEILVANLDKSAHKRLGEIVATIQSEQNEIIRSPLDKVTLVQGVAGAGKTTIALHRLAYIMYNNPDEINPDRVMVIAPNDIFLDYISGILPDLGVENIHQTTIEKFLLEQLKLPKNIKVMNKMEVSALSYENENFREKINSLERIKGDLRVMEQIPNLKQKMEKMIVEQLSETPYYPIHAEKINYDYIRSLFYDYRNSPWEKRIKFITQKVETVLKEEIRASAMNLQSANERIQAELSNVRKYLKQIHYPELIDAYKMFFDETEIARAFPELTSQEIKKFIEEFESLLNENILTSDDLPILYKISELYRENSRADFDYVVIDEAQDLSAVELQVIKENTKENALCIVGDINQTIHNESKFATIRDQINEVFGENYNFYKLLKSYRSTIEITNHANKVLEQLHSPHIATPVIRHGIDPVVMDSNESELIERIKKIVETSEEKGRKSIAITTRTEKFARKIFDELRVSGVKVSFVGDEAKDYDIGVHVMPSYLTKGLEFDSVIVVNEEAVGNTPRDLKLQYVMYTRALHELYVVKVV